MWLRAAPGGLQWGRRAGTTGTTACMAHCRQPLFVRVYRCALGAYLPPLPLQVE